MYSSIQEPHLFSTTTLLKSYILSTGLKCTAECEVDGMRLSTSNSGAVGVG